MILIEVFGLALLMFLILKALPALFVVSIILAIVLVLGANLFTRFYFPPR